MWPILTHWTRIVLKNYCFYNLGKSQSSQISVLVHSGNTLYIRADIFFSHEPSHPSITTLSPGLGQGARDPHMFPNGRNERARWKPPAPFSCCLYARLLRILCRVLWYRAEMSSLFSGTFASSDAESLAKFTVFSVRSLFGGVVICKGFSGMFVRKYLISGINLMGDIFCIMI